MKVKVYFFKESEIEMIIKNNRISNQALFTVYDLVWESEFKNVINVGRIWLMFKQQKKPFGKPLRSKRTHDRIAPGDIIEIGHDHYVVSGIGATRVTVLH